MLSGCTLFIFCLQTNQPTNTQPREEGVHAPRSYQCIRGIVLPHSAQDQLARCEREQFQWNSPTSRQLRIYITEFVAHSCGCACGATENRVHLNFNVIDRHRTPVPFLLIACYLLVLLLLVLCTPHKSFRCVSTLTQSSHVGTPQNVHDK